MARSEPVVLALDELEIRHIAPASVLWPGVTSPIGPSAQVLNQTLFARPLPMDPSISSPDLVSLAYTTRQGDSGEATATFPNGTASDGALYRERFSPTGRLQFFEIRVGGELEQVVAIDTVAVDDGLGFSATQDATDCAASLQGNGAGFNNGTAGQLQALVFDPATLQASLFDLQGWTDFSDASFPSLLATLLNSQLAEQLTPWQLLAVDPSGGGGCAVQVHGQDAMFCLKSAYERDWTALRAPRDVISRSTRLWSPVTVDSFPSSSSIGGTTLTTPFGAWTLVTSGTSSVTVGASGGLVINGSPPGLCLVESGTVTVPSTGTWTATMTAQFGLGGQLNLQVNESNGDSYSVILNSTNAYLATSYGPSVGIATPVATTYNLTLESDGEWVFGFVNGVLLGCLRRGHTATTSLQTLISITQHPATATISDVYVKALVPFLLAGTDQGDYVLPGVASTFPNGGLHARYFNNNDLQGDSNRLYKIHSPPRTEAYTGSGTSQYQDQEDATINGQVNPTPGAANANWSCIWYGAIWLKLSAGNYTFSITLPAHANNQAVRAWVGKTNFGTQLVDQWNFSNTSGQTYTFTVNAAALAGTLPYGQGTVQRDGWYPIKIEYAVDSTSATAPTFSLTNSPAAYTDPGGTAIASGAQSTVVPATSLSALGCVDQRYQGIAHFDLCQQTLQAYGYEAAVEPYPLETLNLSNQRGYFPGTLAPRIREGADYDPILVPDKTITADGQLLLRPQQANTFPLPGSIGKLRWRPGDGLRVQDRDINVWDTSPRQILTFTRNLVPGGIASAVASFANRPLTPGKILKAQMFKALRPQRNYQRQGVELPGNYVSGSIAPGATGASSVLALQPSDQVIRARLRVAVNSAGVSFDLIVNGTDQTGAGVGIAGPWTAVPVNIPIDSVAITSSNNNLTAAIKNNSGTTASDIEYQLFVTVLR